MLVQLFFFLTLALFLGSIFYSLFPPRFNADLSKTKAVQVFLAQLRTDCFKMNFKVVVPNFSLSFRQTNFFLSTAKSVDLSLWFGLLEDFVT